jgi:hypothetical protein
MTMLFVLGTILTFVGFFDGVKHQNFRRGFPKEKAIASLEAKPDRTIYKGGYEVLLYAQLIPPGTIEYRFDNGKFVRKQYVANKRPNEY